MMLGFKPGLYFRACWLFLSPATLLVTGVGGGLLAGGPGPRAGPLWAFSVVGLLWPRVDLCQSQEVGWAPGSALLPFPLMPLLLYLCLA